MQHGLTVIFCSLLCLQCFSFQVSVATGLEEKNGAIKNANTQQLADWRCNTDSDCSLSNSKCIEKTCQCIKGYVFNGNMTSCLKVATAYGDDCEDTIQCSRYLLTGGTCINNVCLCGKGSYYLHGRCIVYSELFKECEKDYDCYVNADFEASSCINKTCKCSPGFYQREYRTCRRAGKAVGEECTVDQDCVFSKAAYCGKNLTCLIKPEDKDKSELLEDYDILDEYDPNIYAETFVDRKCTTNSDCDVLGNAVCGPFGTCICERSHFPSSTNDKCVPELGEPCKSLSDAAHIKYAVCRNGVLNCETNRVVSKNNRKCEKVTRQYKGSCRLDEQCYIFGPDAFCDEKKCTCNENSRFLEDELFCWVKKNVGETCQKDVDCYIEGINTELFCKDNVCSCPKGMHLNQNGTACVYSTAGIGMSCEFDKDCITDNAICADSICACEENYYEWEGTCLAGINSTCTQDSDCGPTHSACHSNVCTCKKNYVAASVDTCLPVVSHGHSCEQDIQCSTMLPNSICSPKDSEESVFAVSSTAEPINKVCTCKEGYWYKFKRCYLKRVLGETCVNRGECYLAYREYRAVCKNGYCECDWDYVQVNNTICDMNFNKKSYINGGVTINNSTGLIAVLFLALQSVRFI